jgi:hypothetical protein
MGPRGRLAYDTRRLSKDYHTASCSLGTARSQFKRRHQINCCKLSFIFGHVSLLRGYPPLSHGIYQAEVPNETAVLPLPSEAGYIPATDVEVRITSS